jgi:hypothetical protein
VGPVSFKPVSFKRGIFRLSDQRDSRRCRSKRIFRCGVILASMYP